MNTSAEAEIVGPNHEDGGLVEWIADSFGGLEGSEANARLIAAAPDLLEALKDVLGPLATVTMADTGHNSEQRPAQPNLRVSGSAIHRARAAIAKATGGAA